MEINLLFHYPACSLFFLTLFASLPMENNCCELPCYRKFWINRLVLIWVAFLYFHSSAYFIKKVSNSNLFKLLDVWRKLFALILSYEYFFISVILFKMSGLWDSIIIDIWHNYLAHKLLILKKQEDPKDDLSFSSHRKILHVI